MRITTVFVRKKHNTEPHIHFYIDTVGFVAFRFTNKSWQTYVRQGFVDRLFNGDIRRYMAQARADKAQIVKQIELRQKSQPRAGNNGNHPANRLPDGHLGPKEVAARLGVSHSLVLSWIAQKWMPATLYYSTGLSNYYATSIVDLERFKGTYFWQVQRDRLTSKDPHVRKAARDLWEVNKARIVESLRGIA